MKKILLTSLLLLHFAVSKSQNLDNPSFDSAYIGGIDRIKEWITSDAWQANYDTVPPLNANDHYVSVGMQYHELLYSAQLEYTNVFHGSLAIKVFSDTGRVDVFGNPFRGFVINGNHFYTDANGYLDAAKCGTPFPYRPYKLIGHYMLSDSSVSLHNYPEAMILLKKYNSVTQTSDTIGYANASMQLFATSTWLPFEMPINYVSSQTPDSIVVAFFSPPLGHMSTLWVDSLGFDFNFPSKVEEHSTNHAVSFQFNNTENIISFSSIESIAAINVYSVTGQLIQSIKKAEIAIHLPEIQKGVYITSVEYKNGSMQSFTFVKK